MSDLVWDQVCWVNVLKRLGDWYRDSAYSVRSAGDGTCLADCVSNDGTNWGVMHGFVVEGGAQDFIPLILEMGGMCAV